MDARGLVRPSLGEGGLNGHKEGRCSGRRPGGCRQSRTGVAYSAEAAARSCARQSGLRRARSAAKAGSPVHLLMPSWPLMFSSLKSGGRRRTIKTARIEWPQKPSPTRRRCRVRQRTKSRKISISQSFHFVRLAPLRGYSIRWGCRFVVLGRRRRGGSGTAWCVSVPARGPTPFRLRARPPAEYGRLLPTGCHAE
jgi:hypothetical protein